jgi:hypothetical protein
MKLRSRIDTLAQGGQRLGRPNKDDAGRHAGFSLHPLGRIRACLLTDAPFTAAA